MSVFRKSLAWLVLAAYLGANTLSAALHDHRDCGGHATGARDGACAQHQAANHCEAHSHQHDSGAHHHRVSDHDRGHDHTRGGTADEVRAPHHCVVCEFLAQAPLAPQAAGLMPAGELPPGYNAPALLAVAQKPATVHLARGPPTAV